MKYSGRIDCIYYKKDVQYFETFKIESITMTEIIKLQKEILDGGKYYIISVQLIIDTQS